MYGMSKLNLGSMDSDNQNPYGAYNETVADMQARRREQQEEMDKQLQELLRQDPRSMKPIVMKAAQNFDLTPAQKAALSIYGSPAQGVTPFKGAKTPNFQRG